MKQQVLFIQGGGDDGYEADKAMVNSLSQTLGDAYQVSYPSLSSDEGRTDFRWPQQIGELLHNSAAPLLVVAHSVGASLLLKYLSENPIPDQVTALFLLAVPFWSGHEDWKQGLILKNDFGASLPDRLPIYLYHCQDDEEVPIAQLTSYVQQLPRAIVRQPKTGGHQFNNDLVMVAKDIKAL